MEWGAPRPADPEGPRRALGHVTLLRSPDDRVDRPVRARDLLVCGEPIEILPQPSIGPIMISRRCGFRISNPDRFQRSGLIRSIRCSKFRQGIRRKVPPRSGLAELFTPLRPVVPWSVCISDCAESETRRVWVLSSPAWVLREAQLLSYLLSCVGPAIDVEAGAGDVGGVRAREKSYQGRDFLRLAKASQCRHLLLET